MMEMATGRMLCGYRICVEDILPGMCATHTSNSTIVRHRLTFESSAGDQQMLQASAVVLTVPAYVASKILSQAVPRAAQDLESIDYPPIAAVILSYPTSAIRPEFLDENGMLTGTFTSRAEKVAGVKRTHPAVYLGSSSPHTRPTVQALGSFTPERKISGHWERSSQAVSSLGE